jgi:transcriptional regulator GlxA family with amidase domain
MPLTTMPTRKARNDSSYQRLDEFADCRIGTKAFTVQTAGPDKADYFVTSSQGLKIKVDMDHEDAHEALDEFDVLVVCGGNTDLAVKGGLEPISLVKAWAELQKTDPSKERTLLSVCTGSLFLAVAGVLQGLSATTHPDYYTQFEILCQEVAQKDTGVGTDVQEERYVVNNARFELGENILDNPFVYTKRPDITHKKSNARKGSDAFRAARRRESLIKRQNMPLGGLRVITSGGITAGMDASLYLVAALVSIESAQEVARVMQYTWQKGVCVEGIDV